MTNGTQYAYDAENRVSALNGGESYVYDAEGNRVAKLSGGVVTNLYLLGPGGEQVSELDGQGNWLRSYVYGKGGQLAKYDQYGVHFDFTDWLGTRRVQGNSSGAVEESCVSLPFGDGLQCYGGNGQPNSDNFGHHFTGKERDNESGLDYFGARYNSSTMGRFMSPDPIGISPELGNPQSWNKYSYTFNNPLKMVDPDGEWPFYIHNAIIEASFSGVLSSRQIGLIEHESYLMDFAKGQQDPANANQHGMCVPGQNAGACNAGVANFVDGVFSKASAASGDDRIELFADMGHTVMDLGSPEHVDSDGLGITWNGGLRQEIPHMLGESTITGNFFGVGKSIRYLIELYALLNPDEAKKQGGTAAWEDRAINGLVDTYMNSLTVQSQRQGVKNGQGHSWEDMMRQCALGNPAACNF